MVAEFSLAVPKYGFGLASFLIPWVSELFQRLLWNPTLGGLTL